MDRKLSLPALSSALAISAALASVGGVGAQDATTDPDMAADSQTPAWTSSIVVPTDEAQQEADEAAALEPLATVTPDEASTAALESTPGTVESVLLHSEDGNVVYSVLITDDAGTLIDVKIDAGNATVLEAAPATDEAADAEDDDSAVQGEASEGGEGGSAEGGDEGEDDQD